LFLDVFGKRIRHISAVIVGDTGGGLLDFFHQAIEIIAGGRDADDADCRSVPDFGSIEFGNGYVEAGAQAVFHAPHNLATIFQRLRSFDVEFDGKEGNHQVASV
jgi:hypothetical protein